MGVLEEQMRNALARYCGGSSSLDEFRSWFVPVSWNIEGAGEPGAIELAHLIDGTLGESSSADWPEGDLKEELTRIVGPFLVPTSRFGVATYPQKMALSYGLEKIVASCSPNALGGIDSQSDDRDWRYVLPKAS